MEAADEPKNHKSMSPERGGFLRFIHGITSQLVRLTGLTIIRIFYRIRAVHPENLPKEGGVMLLPNHISWGDAFFLTAACPRPVRFVMEGTFMKNPLVRGFCSLFNTVPISAGKPREALRIAAEAIKKGDVVCIYPEGQLSRIGTLQELKRGCEIIARLSGCPSVPVWSDGPWGSIFSFERNRFFTKWPRRIPYNMRFAFGDPLAPDEISLEVLRERMLDASIATLEDRVQRSRWPKDRLRDWANGYQLGQINALPRRSPLAVLAEDPLIAKLGGLDGFAALFRSKPTHGEDQDHWLGGDALRLHLESLPEPPHTKHFYDFGESANSTFNRPGWLHLPCLSIDGVIISMSSPTPQKSHSRSPSQPGSKDGSRGLLLPGFSYRKNDENEITIVGPAAENEGIKLPAGSRIDSQGFVFLG